MYEKVHVTPDEQKSWGLSGGKMVKTFDTDCARIGVLICYDVEFPELSRIMADQGMQILFVPSLRIRRTVTLGFVCVPKPGRSRTSASW